MSNKAFITVLIVGSVSVFGVLLVVASSGIQTLGARTPIVKQPKTEPTAPTIPIEPEANGHAGLADCESKQVPAELCTYRLRTFAYIWNLDGTLSFLCDSVGFGLPHAVTSRTNESKSTWIVCIDPEDSVAKAMYVEPNVMVVEFKLQADGGSLQRAASARDSP